MKNIEKTNHRQFDGRWVCHAIVKSCTKAVVASNSVMQHLCFVSVVSACSVCS